MKEIEDIGKNFSQRYIEKLNEMEQYILGEEEESPLNSKDQQDY